jgi:hypothetical protein
MTSWANVKEKIKGTFKKKADYKEMYDAERRIAESWEFRYNKLYRQLNAILKEGDNG